MVRTCALLLTALLASSCTLSLIEGASSGKDDDEGEGEGEGNSSIDGTAEDDETGEGQVCGDGIVNINEQCDTDDLGTIEIVARTGCIDTFGIGGQELHIDDVWMCEPCDSCPEDVDGDGIVGFSDLLAMLTSWGPCAGCPEDVDGDGTVGFSDLLAALTRWGPC